ncbi:MAG: hydrogenase formation protein HypD [Xanthobacteraceae bacterium]|nr:hydrogenase formation protein HypD [Xanthobacteraceae bacterium]
MTSSARTWLDRIRDLPLTRPVSILNVCGGHERTLAAAGLRKLMPPGVNLIPGPGCPVCVCPEEDVFEAIRLVMHERVVLVAFGDMLRVPVNVPKGEPRSLEQAKALGADIRPIASPMEAAAVARGNPERPVVFFVAGFETTLAPVAALVSQGLPRNLLLLVAGRLTWPAVAMLLRSERPGFDALIAPGHVATVMGPEEWEFVVRDHAMPAAIGGFTTESLLAATYSTLRQIVDGCSFLDNCYGESVRPGGNPTARRCIAETMDVVEAGWRGIGIIPDSGYRLRPVYAAHDARRHFPADQGGPRPRRGEMPPGCDCARVILGKVLPTDCRLYGSACTPDTAIGPCMVSDEGACHVWWSAGHRRTRSRPAAIRADRTAAGRAPP